MAYKHLILATKARKHKETRRCLRPQPKKGRRMEGWKVRKAKKIRQNILPQKHCYKLVSSCTSKYSCQKNKKLTDSITKGHKEKKSIQTIPIKNFGESGRGWQPQPIREGFNAFLFSPMTNDICMKGFWPPGAKVTVDLGVEKFAWHLSPFSVGQEPCTGDWF